MPSIDNVTYMTNQAKTIGVALTQFVGAADRAHQGAMVGLERLEREWAALWVPN